MARPIRNMDGIQFEVLRKKIDQHFYDLVDSLEEAYYGQRDADGRFIPNTGWRDGVSSPWFGFDKGADPVESKDRFDEIHGFIWDVYSLVFHERNQTEPTPYSRDQYDYVRDEQGQVVLSRIENVRQKLRWLRVNRPNIFDRLKTWAQNNGWTFNPDATD